MCVGYSIDIDARLLANALRDDKHLTSAKGSNTFDALSVTIVIIEKLMLTIY
jgi:hypothetical protein